MTPHHSDSLDAVKRFDKRYSHGYSGLSSGSLENSPMETSSERRKRRLQWLVDKHGLLAVAVKAKISHAGLDQILKGVLLPPKADGTRSPKSLGNHVAQQIEDAFELGRGWFDLPGAPEHHIVAPAYVFRDAGEPADYLRDRQVELDSQAHRLSEPRATLPLKRIVLGEEVDEDALPSRFELQVLDDSLVGFIEQGEWAICSRTSKPRVGKGVLVADGQNRPYLRKLEQGLPHEQFAVATKPGFRAMPIGPGGVRIIAAVLGSYFDDEEA